MFFRLDNIEHFSTTETDPETCDLKLKWRDNGPHNHDGEKSHVAPHTNHQKKAGKPQIVEISNTRIGFLRKKPRKNH